MTVTAVIADDHAFFRRTLREFLAGTGTVHVVGEAGNGREAVALAKGLRQELVIMDVRMPEMDGAEACRQIKASRPGTRVILYSVHEPGRGAAAADRVTPKDRLFEDLPPLLGGRAEHA